MNSPSPTWNILYRGSLSSCNYACDYCPFAKTSNTIAELAQDERELDRFASWVGSQSQRRIGILITPWGEALVHRYYRQAMERLSHMPNVYRIAIQTNLSAPVGDLASSDLDALSLWTTFHPSQVPLDRFLSRCRNLDEAGIRYSVGAVGLREHLAPIESLRKQLKPDVYLWVNAYKRDPDYYQPGEIERLRSIDPYFHWNLQRYASAAKPCDAGLASFTVDGDGEARRCHFIPAVIGNIHQPNFAENLKPSACSAATCGCHIGYVHRPQLALGDLFADGILDRIPARWPEIDAEFAHPGRL